MKNLFTSIFIDENGINQNPCDISDQMDRNV